MLKGSSFLLEKSIKYYEPLIKNVAKFDSRIWDIDIDGYNSENKDLLLECKDVICKSLGRENKPSDILVTKIMLGIFSNTPAFDNFFCKGIGVRSFNKKSLLKIAEFYNQNKDLIDSYKINTLDFNGTKTFRIYNRAKIIDMIFLIEGQNKS
jgi:hypothetical protein